MSTPFAVNSKPHLLHSLEQECASRYASQANLLEEIIAENRRLRLQRDAARDALSETINSARRMRLALSQFLMRGPISAEAIEQAREALL